MAAEGKNIASTTIAGTDREQTKLIPKRFNGNRNNYRSFRDSVDLFFVLEGRYNTDEKRVAFVLSLLDEGEARTWRTNYLRNLRQLGLTLESSTFADFSEKLDATFKRKNEEEEALHDVHRMKQGNDETAEQVITRFREKAALAEIDLEGAGRLAIDYLRDVLKPGLVEKLSTDINEPGDKFEDWVKLAIRYDNAYRRGKSLKSFRKMPPVQRRFTTLPRFQRPDPNAMEVDALSMEKRAELMKRAACFKCEKSGHRARDCPDKNQQPKPSFRKAPVNDTARYIRTLMAQYTPEEEEQIHQAYEKLDEEDF
jgi:hypothetical protein